MEKLAELFEVYKVTPRDRATVIDDIVSTHRKFTQQFTPDYKQDFPSKQAVFKADIQTELIAKMLRAV